MDSEPNRSLNNAELQKAWMEEELYKHQRLLAELESPIPEFYTIPIQTKDALVKIRMRPLNHGEIMTVTMLPFFPKIASKEKLTESEDAAFRMIEERMLDGVALDFNQWVEVSTAHPEVVDATFATMLNLCGVNDELYRKLSDFIASDNGRDYGLAWFQMMGKTPSEVGKLSEKDYQAVALWIKTWSRK